MRLNLEPQLRCQVCRMHRQLCLCSIVPKIDIRTRVVVAMHIAEKNKPSSSARLLNLALPNSEVRYQGLVEQPLPLEGLVVPERQTFLLFPEADLKPRDILGNGRPITLVVPDGTWQQAKKIAATITRKLQIPRLSIPGVDCSSYRLRVADREGRLSTLEAVARVLGVIEGEPVRSELEKLFNEMVERVLVSRNGRRAVAR